jgi:hypothetical protein
MCAFDFQNLLHITALLTSQQMYFIVNCLLLYVFMALWFELSEDGDNAETCRN